MGKVLVSLRLSVDFRHLSPSLGSFKILALVEMPANFY